MDLEREGGKKKKTERGDQPFTFSDAVAKNKREKVGFHDTSKCSRQTLYEPNEFCRYIQKRATC